MTNLKLLLAFSLATSTTALADTTKPGPAPTDPKLAQLVGHWEGTGNFTLEGKAMTYKIAYTCERAAVGPGISCGLVAAGKDIHYEEAHLFGYDRATDTYHLFSVNDWGEAYDHSTKWTDATKVSFQFDGTESSKESSKPVREVYDFTFKTGELAVHGKFTSGSHTVGEGTYTMKRLP